MVFYKSFLPKLKAEETFETAKNISTIVLSLKMFVDNCY